MQSSSSPMPPTCAVVDSALQQVGISNSSAVATLLAQVGAAACYTIWKPLPPWGMHLPLSGPCLAFVWPLSGQGKGEL